MRRRGLVVLISDLYDDRAVDKEIRRLSRMGHDVIVIHTLAPEELNLPGDGAAEFEDLETGARVITAPRMIREEYARAVRSFLMTIEQALRREGLDYVRLLTSEPIEPPLRRLLLGRRGGR
jgi:hypothetical protein